MKKRIVILMYHMISEPESRSEREKRFVCQPKRFAEHMRFLKKRNYTFVSLETILAFLRGQDEVTPNSIAVTIDDGVADAYEHALPTIAREGIPVSLFVTAGMIGKTNSWMQSGTIAKRRMLTWSEVQLISQQGVTIGSHTLNHPELPALSDRQALWEIGASKKLIEDKLGRAVDQFAYPYGSYDKRIRDMVEDEGYSLACSARSGFNNVHTGVFELRRLEVYGTDSVRTLSQKITFGTNETSRLYPLKYYTGRLQARLQKKEMT